MIEKLVRKLAFAVKVKYKGVTATILKPKI
jgi:hypothetical protein